MKTNCEICGREFVARTAQNIRCPECREWERFGYVTGRKQSRKLSDGMKKLLADSRSADAAGLSYGEYMARRHDAVAARQRVRRKRTVTA